MKNYSRRPKLCCIYIFLSKSNFVKFDQVHTPAVPNYVAYIFLSKSNFVKFDQVHSKIYELL
jgi:hypothetical protein